jgi:hypothetical protein
MIDFPLSRLQPQAAAVYAALGLKSGRRPSVRSSALLQQALDLFHTCSEPLGFSDPISPEEFAGVFAGQGRNAPDTPLQKIFPRADGLHLFAFTLGEKISGKIKHLFKSDDFALGSILDAVASIATDNAGRVAEEWAERQGAGKKDGALSRAFLYSPGYCGWHISGQAKLFVRLRPEKIGISLNASFLMNPLKSISGVLVAGPAAVHQFSEVYPFCTNCKSPICRERGMARSA